MPIDVELSELRAFTSYEPDADAARHLLRLDENRANAASRRWTTTFGTFVRYTLGRSERAPYAYLSVPLARILRDTPDRSHGKQFVNDVMRVDDGGTSIIDDDTIQVDDELVIGGAARAREAPMVSLWAGGANVTTQAHYDLHANLFVQVAGRKRVALWPPEAASSLYLYGALHPRFRKSRLPIADDLSELPNATLAAFPRAAGVMAKARIVVLEPHDVLFIPPLWLHHVTALDELTLSVNVFSHSDEQAVFDELFALAVPFEASWMEADASGRRPLLLAATRAWLRRLADAELDGGRAELRGALLDAGYQPPDGAPRAGAARLAAAGGHGRRVRRAGGRGGGGAREAAGRRAGASTDAAAVRRHGARQFCGTRRRVRVREGLRLASVACREARPKF